MSEKLDTLIARHGEDWKVLAERYEELRAEIKAGRSAGHTEQPAENVVFKDNLLSLLGDGAPLTFGDSALLDELAAKLVGLIRDAVQIVDIWRKPDQVRRLRASIDTELMVSRIEAVQSEHKRIAIELTKLAEKRHEELVRA
jgi:type I restriction enzyme R subunit